MEHLIIWTMPDRATREIADGFLMKDFVESESIRGESVRTMLTEYGKSPKGVMSVRQQWQEYVMEAGVVHVPCLYVHHIIATSHFGPPPCPHRHCPPSHHGSFSWFEGGRDHCDALGKQSGGHFNPAITLSMSHTRWVKPVIAAKHRKDRSDA
jgi:hypothetical protein